MLSLIKFYSRFKAQFKVEMLLNFCVITIILAILFAAGLALVRPVSTKHYHKIVQLSEQDAYPDVKEMALRLRYSDHIRTADYFRLMHAYRIEMQHVREFPAESTENK